jgi:hypothetical protein
VFEFNWRPESSSSSSTTTTTAAAAAVAAAAVASQDSLMSSMTSYGISVCAAPLVLATLRAEDEFQPICNSIIDDL